jgi:hypothetical protein
VLTKGKPHTFKCCVPSGGQIEPTVTAGLRLKWKKAQKKAKKSITSERMKRIIPIRRPCCTFEVWYPWLDSLIMEMNQLMAVKYRPKKLTCIKSARGRPSGNSKACI